jgi:hypothetical protein
MYVYIYTIYIYNFVSLFSCFTYFTTIFFSRIGACKKHARARCPAAPVSLLYIVYTIYRIYMYYISYILYILYILYIVYTIYRIVHVSYILYILYIVYTIYRICMYVPCSSTCVAFFPAFLLYYYF